MLNTIIRVIGLVWRIIATGLCFSVFGLGGLFLALLLFPVQRLFQRCPVKQKENARTVVHYSFKFFVALMHYTGAIRFILKIKPI